MCWVFRLAVCMLNIILVYTLLVIVVVTTCTAAAAAVSAGIRCYVCIATGVCFHHSQCETFVSISWLILRAMLGFDVVCAIHTEYSPLRSAIHAISSQLISVGCR